MPFYIFSCPSCGVQEEDFSHAPDGGTSLPKRWCCGYDVFPHKLASMERDYMAEAGHHVPSSAWPMVIKHFDGTPRLVKSASEHASLAKEFGLTVRDDAAFEDEGDFVVERGPEQEIVVQLEGRDPVVLRKRRPQTVYREGSGVGLPRSWVGLPPLATAPKEEVERFFDRKETK